MILFFLFFSMRRTHSALSRAHLRFPTPSFRCHGVKASAGQYFVQRTSFQPRSTHYNLATMNGMRSDEERNAAARAPTLESKSKSTKIAVAQLSSTSSKAVNLATISKLAASAASSECSMLFLPEIATLLPPKGTTIHNAEPIPTPPCSPPFQSSSLQTLSETAKRNRLCISVGSMHESGAVLPNTAEPRVWNTSVVIDSNGDLIGKYRKIHLFSIDTATTRLSETSTTVAGTHLSPAMQTPIGPLGLAICYDLRFPYLSTALRYTHGAACIIYPSAFTVETGLRDWETLLRARAIENQCWIVAAAQAGKHEGGRRSYGHSLVVDPLGAVVLDMGGYETAEDDDVDASLKNIVRCVDVDLDLVRRVREEVLQVERHQVELHDIKSV